MQTDKLDQEGDAQDNFVEARDPTELAMCFILASAYLGLAKYCWEPLLLAHNWKLLVNVEGFFVTISAISILVGMRPYMSPSNLQLSSRGIKYRGPYWPQRKTVNWDQIYRLYLSRELVVVLYRSKPGGKRIWPMFITSIYLAERDRIIPTFVKHSPVQPVIMTSPTIVSRIFMGILFLGVVIWILEMLMN